MIIQFPIRLRTFQDRKEELVMEILQVVYDEWSARGYDCEPWLDELAEIFEEIAD